MMNADQATGFVLLVLCGLGPLSGLGWLLLYRLWRYLGDRAWVITISRQAATGSREKQQ